MSTVRDPNLSFYQGIQNTTTELVAKVCKPHEYILTSQAFKFTDGNPKKQTEYIQSNNLVFVFQTTHTLQSPVMVATKIPYLEYGIHS